MNFTYDIAGKGLHAFTFSQNTKPVKAIDALFQHLTPFSTPFALTAGDMLPLSPDKDSAGIILLKHGVCSVCHKESGLYISSAFSPSVMGLIDGYSLYYDVPERPQHLLYAETDCTGYFVRLNDFISLAEERGLWHDVARILAHRLMLMSARDRELVGVDSYQKVRPLLIELWLYSPKYREKINVMSFIQRRTGLSRSRTLKILSELRRGEFITITGGKLVAIHKLPTAF